MERRKLENLEKYPHGKGENILSYKFNSHMIQCEPGLKFKFIHYLTLQVLSAMLKQLESSFLKCSWILTLIQIR